MYYVELKRIKFLSLIIILFFAFLFLSFSVRAEEELILLPDGEQTVNNDFSEDDNLKSTIVRRKSRTGHEPFLRDSTFMPSNNNATFNALAGKVSLIVFILVGFLILIKLAMSRNQFGKPGSLLDELTQKIAGSFSNSSSLHGLKLKQTLILTPGQNLYLIEVDGKKLLVGGTQQGGVQFLCDLTQNILKNEKPDFKQVEESTMHTNEIPFMTQDILSNKDLPDEVKQKIVVNDLHNRQTFKRRTNFRKSLFTENINHAEELLRKA